MNQALIFWPVIAQVALVYAIYVLISRRRIEAVKAGSAKASQFRENQVEPPESLFVRNNLTNQFELPVLFYVCCLALNAAGAVNEATFVLAWLFVTTRVIHAWIHVTSNRVRRRRMMFILGWFILAAMWLALAWKLAMG